MAVLVISWKIIRRVVVTGNLNMSQICHPIASPSRSSSVAIITFPIHDSISFLIRVICFDFSSIHENLSLKVSVLIDLRPSSVRKCPKVAMHLYPGPRYDSILLHFAGDSTITRVVVADVFACLDICRCVANIYFDTSIWDMLYGIELNVYMFIFIILIISILVIGNILCFEF